MKNGEEECDKIKNRLKNGDEVAHLTVLAKVTFLPEVIKFVRDVSIKLGIADDDVMGLELIVEEACVNVIEHAFDPGDQGSYEVIILRKPGKVMVAIEDQGLPLDFKKFENEKNSGLGMILMKAFADEIRFFNLGRHGKRVELIKNISYKDVNSYISEEEKERKSLQEPIKRDIPITFRLMKPKDSVDLARCIYRCYGYTYSNDMVYYPKRVSELLESGLLISYIATDSEGEVIGHCALNLYNSTTRIGELVTVVVDPRYRGRGLFKELKKFLIDHAKEKGMYGTYSEAVAVHPYTQKGNISTGARETGILLSFTPATMLFKKIDDKERQLRQTAVLFYEKIKEEPIREVYLPFHHKTIIQKIYKENKLNRKIINTGDIKETIKLPLSSQVNIKVQTIASRAFIYVTNYGNDLEELVKFRLRELCQRRIDCIYLDLPLSHPALPKFCASMEMLGFFFTGIIPELFDGDVLRLQYLNNVKIDTENVEIYSDFGKELYNYIIKGVL